MKLITYNGYCVYHGNCEHRFLNGLLVISLEEGEVTYGDCKEDCTEIHLNVVAPEDFTLLKYKYLEGEFSISERHDSLCVEVREERNTRLSDTDWTANSDVTMSTEMTAYRQALRDISSQDGFPDNITWPTKP